ncbi:PAS domain-containing sensor histidine kinase [Jannaschia donghaensis]|uniref:histidine kinase n=1 Tax=Jannaschia donghaensis TaxID=420998 RepID=A0A0M6YJK2_9RHOB|nr:PAS domain-containing sensor histidine kinase [Jannaschia donghaensis]CTQ50130.1 Bacteriophytochrome [Jannaschia donghaensis]
MFDKMDKESLTWRVTPDLLGVTDANGMFKETNPAWFQTLGYRPEEIENTLFFEFLHPEDLANTAKAFVDIQMGKPILQFENRYRHKNGSYRWLSWNAVPEGDLFVCNARDVTAAKEAQSALALREAEANLREQFIAILGHDLRNPLAGAACAVEYLMDRETLTDNGITALHTANLSLRRMSRLIDDVLDFARARMGGDIGIDPEKDVALRPILELTVEEMKYAHSDVTFEEHYDFSDPVTCDPDRIAQLVSNLLGNAVFHGEPDGTVRMEARDTATELFVSITNRGGQIPASVKALLFEPFKRVEPGSSQNGLGLGLFISKQIADQHGGDIEVHSDARETTFTLRLPRGTRLMRDLARDALRRVA